VYETHREELLPKPQFVRRVVLHFVVASLGIGIALAIGVLGYHFLGGFPWIDSLLNASMILGGMGPIDRLPDSRSKLFASCYALFSGLVFITATGLVLAPWAHRLMHRLHLDDE
jgi:hypothetical protein